VGVNLSRLPTLDIKKGVLEEFPLAFLLGTAKVWELIGVLTIERNKAHKEIFFLQGLPVYCKSDLTGESLRQVMYKAGIIDHQTLAKVQECMEQERVEEDRALLELGVLDDSTRYSHLQEQARKRILSSFAWAGGRYKFEAREDFLDRIELFDIDPLEVIHEGITTHHVLDIAGIIQEAASENVVASEQIEDFESFVERFYPDANPVWSNNSEQPLGNIVGQLHPDISKSLDLAFILLAAGGLLVGGKRPGELKPPPMMESDMATAGDVSGADPWTDEVESPSLEEEDFPETVKEPPSKMPSEPKPSTTVESFEEKSGDEVRVAAAEDIFATDPWSEQAESPGPDKKKDEDLSKIKAKPSPKPRKPAPPPPEPPWKKRERAARKRPSASPTRAGAGDSELERRYKKMLEVVRGGAMYEILDVTTETPPAEIKKAFFYRYNQYDPDKAKSLGPNGERIVKEIHEGLRDAYDALLDPARRHEYEMNIFADEKKKAWSMELRKKLAKKQFSRGKWYLSQRHPELALSFFDSAVNLDAEQAPYYAFLGWTQYASRKGDASASMAFIRTALGINSKLPEAYMFLGWINKDIGEEEKAIECFRLALDYDPKNAFANQELQRAGSTKKKSDGAGLIKRFFKK